MYEARASTRKTDGRALKTFVRKITQPDTALFMEAATTGLENPRPG